MIINRDGIWCWYMMFEISIFYYGIWCSHMMFTCDTQIPTFHFRIWCSHVICTIIVYDVGIWCLYMMFTCDFICEDFRFCIWSFAYDVHMWCHMWRFLIWYMKLVYDNHPWSSSLIIWPTVCDHIRTFFENFHFPKIPYMMFTCEHFRIWCSHVNTFSHEMMMKYYWWKGENKLFGPIELQNHSWLSDVQIFKPTSGVFLKSSEKI
mgnify:CR=1 FL=1